ncbi:MAG TPA: aminotransferase class III-fold pyridoxal phosphate-dependent enzyme [Chloroflexia bacterium]|nr:aminotransferase class III-fold pyridoxal phosphate-dependent enzyme [Chloroflexia bacterium]
MTFTSQGVNAEQVKADSRQHVMVSWSAQKAANAGMIVVNEARGSYFWDTDGKRYLDFSSQLINSNIGHQHPKVVAAIKEQAEKLCFIGPNFANDARATLARRLAEITPGDLTKTLFTNGGAEANENAIKMARLYTGRHKIITRYRSYHGATAGASTLSGDNRRWANEPGIPGIVRVFDPSSYNCVFHPGSSVCNGQCSRSIEETIWSEGPDSIAAILVEVITGTNGIFVPPPDYIPNLRQICDKYGILLIFDEVMTGFGRTGKWFAADHYGVTPDIMTFAKGVNSGYVPLGGAIMNQKLADFFEDHMFWGGLTYSGHPLACAAGVATIEVYEQEGLIERSATLGEKLRAELAALMDKHPSIGDVRGLGLFCGIELVKSRETREQMPRWNGKDQTLTNRLKNALMGRGVFVFCRYNMLFVAPPLTVSEEELMVGVRAIDEVLSIADEEAAR